MFLPMEKQKDLTTKEAARITSVSFQTIIDLCDNGHLKYFRVPGSRFRRIPRIALYKFMIDNGVPTDRLDDTTKKRALLLGEQDTADALQNDETGLEVTRVESSFDAGMEFIAMTKCTPPITSFIIDQETLEKGSNPQSIAEAAKEKDIYGLLKLVSLKGDQPEGFDLHFPEGILGSEQIEKIQRLVGIELEDAMLEPES